MLLSTSQDPLYRTIMVHARQVCWLLFFLPSTAVCVAGVIGPQSMAALRKLRHELAPGNKIPARNHSETHFFQSSSNLNATSERSDIGIVASLRRAMSETTFQDVYTCDSVCDDDYAMARECLSSTFTFEGDSTAKFSADCASGTCVLSLSASEVDCLLQRAIDDYFADYDIDFSSLRCDDFPSSFYGSVDFSTADVCGGANGELRQGLSFTCVGDQFGFEAKWYLPGSNTIGAQRCEFTEVCEGSSSTVSMSCSATSSTSSTTSNRFSISTLAVVLIVSNTISRMVV